MQWSPYGGIFIGSVVELLNFLLTSERSNNERSSDISYIDIAAELLFDILQVVADAGVEQHIFHLQHKTADQVFIDGRFQLDILERGGRSDLADDLLLQLVIHGNG